MRLGSARRSLLEDEDDPALTGQQCETDKGSVRKNRVRNKKTTEKCQQHCSSFPWFVLEGDLDCACYNSDPCAGRQSGSDTAYATASEDDPALTYGPSSAPTTQQNVMSLNSVSFTTCTNMLPGVKTTACANMVGKKLQALEPHDVACKSGALQAFGITDRGCPNNQMRYHYRCGTS